MCDVDSLVKKYGERWRGVIEDIMVWLDENESLWDTTKLDRDVLIQHILDKARVLSIDYTKLEDDTC